MEPSIVPGDRIVVWKPWMGARVFDLFASLGGEQPEIYRIPGLRSPERNDVMVFNYPYYNGWNEIKMHIRRYYVKRCLALPGDTICIENGWYRIAGFSGIVGNPSGQRKIAEEPEMQLKERNMWKTFPNDSLSGWNIKNFGPLTVPEKGTEIEMNLANMLLYRPLIEWESREALSFNALDSAYYLGDCKISTYRFRQNYYFMAGDRVEDSEDSRHWGLVPEPFIVGKAAFVYKSYEPVTGRFRWDRWLKKIE